MRKTVISIIMTAMMSVLFLASAGQSNQVGGDPVTGPVFEGVPSSYYLYGDLYEPLEGDLDYFSQWYRNKRDLTYGPVRDIEEQRAVTAGDVSTHLDGWPGFNGFNHTPDDPGRGGNVITVPPTYTGTVPGSPIARRAASLATLDALQAAIDGAPNNSVIQLGAGYYDLSAVIDNLAGAACEYSFYNGMTGQFCQKAGPYSLMSHLGSTDVPAGYGLVVLGKKKLVIAGTTDDNGVPLTIFLGNPMAIASFMGNSYLYNVGISIGGNSNQVTVTGIEFRDFAFPVRILDHYSLPVPSGLMFSSDPAFAGGSHKATISQNVFVQPVTAVLVEGRHVLPTVEENVMTLGPTASGRAAVSVFSVPGKQLENPRIIGNMISGMGPVAGINIAWGFVTNGWIKENIITGGTFGVQMLGSTDWQIQNNTFNAQMLGGILLRSNVYTVPGEVLPEQYLMRSSENEIIGNTIVGGGVPGTATGISLWGATLNTITGNQIQGTQLGIYLFVDLTLMALSLPFEAHYVPADFNEISFNTLNGCGISILLANYARNNDLVENDINFVGFGLGYQLMGVLNADINVSLGRASGNYIQDADLATNPFLVADLSACSIINGITFCPQIDYDNDGLLNEDEINGLNDDGDMIFVDPGLPQYLFDEDASDEPNVYVATAPDKSLIANAAMSTGSESNTVEMTCHPNPVDSRSTVTVTLKEDTHMKLNLYNEQGQDVLNLDEQFRSAGTYQYEIVRRDLSPGMYVLQLITQKDVLTQKIILGR